MDYSSLLCSLEQFSKKYRVRSLGKTNFNRDIFAVEKVSGSYLSTAILVAAVHAREDITTDLVIKMLEENLFDSIAEFNVSVIPMLNPDGVELSKHGIMSAKKTARKNLIKANGDLTDFSLWKANGRGVDINNNFDAKFNEHTSSNLPASQGFAGKFPESEVETKSLVNYTKSVNPFITISYHSKGEEIYFNFFQDGKRLARDEMIAKRFSQSTNYAIKNPEASSSGGFKDYCVSKLKIPALTIEVGSDELSHPIQRDHLDEIYGKHKLVANDLKFAYNVFKETELCMKKNLWKKHLPLHF